MLLFVVGTDIEHRARPPLTLAAMAREDGIGLAGYFDTQGAARALRSSRHHPLRHEWVAFAHDLARFPQGRPA